MWRNRYDVQTWKRLLSALLVAIGASSIATAQQSTMLRVNPSSVQFGTTEVGDTRTRSFSVHNNGSTDVSLVLSSTSGVFTVGGDATITLEAGASESIEVRYTPLQGDIPPITDTGSIVLVYTANAGTDSIATGTMMVRLRGFARDRGQQGGGSDSGDIDVSAGVIDFGTVDSGDTESRTLTVYNRDNSGSLSVRIVNPDDPFGIISGGGSFVLGGNGSRAVRLRFSPEASGTFNNTLLVIHGSGSGLDTVMVRLIGRGRTPIDTTSRPGLLIGPGSLQFGAVQVGDMETRVLTLRNVGGSGTIGGRIDSSLLDVPFAIIAGSDTFSIAAGGTHTVMVRFAPTARGSYNDALVVNYNVQGNAAAQVIPVFGVGIATTDDGNGNGGDDLRSSTVTVDFGTVPRNTAVMRTITLWSANTSGDVSLTGNIGGDVNAPFSIVSGGGPFALGAGTTTQLTLQFMPTANGAFSDTVMATYNRLVNGVPTGGMDTLRVRMVGRSFTGRGPDTLVVDVGDSVVVVGGTVVVGGNGQSVVDVGNPGNTTVIVSIHDVDPPFMIDEEDASVVLPPNTDWQFPVRFVPQAPGVYTDTAYVVVDNGYSLDSSIVVLNGVAAASDVRDVDGTIRNAGVSLTLVHPNPVRTSATIGFTLPRAGQTTLELFAADGRKIATIVDERLPAGSRNVTFDASSLESGAYFYRLTVDGVALTQQMTVTR